MTFGEGVKWFLLYSVAAYAVDVPLRRALAASRARRIARANGGPLLSVGAGTRSSALFGPTLYGDVNVDLCGRLDVPHGTPGVVTYADAQDLSDFALGQFGAVLAVHVLEHLADPGRALAEWARVAGGLANVVVVTPSWWAPHTWLHPGHVWAFVGGRRYRLRAAPPNACAFVPWKGASP